ncbi:S8 family serine peptidase [soil metagenome]
MKKVISILAFLLFLQFSFAQSSKTYLVVFKDKNNSPYSVAQPSKFLSEKAIARRQKQNIAIDMSDLPVNPSYVNSVNAVGVGIKSQSKWMNAISVSTNDETKINSIKKLKFVKEVILTSDPAATKIHTTKFDEANNLKPVTTEVNQKMVSTVLNYGPSFFQANQIGIDCMHNMGYMGQGMTIAILDAGFYKADSLPAFDSLRTNNQILGCRDIVAGDTMVYEDYPHGMNVLSCMGGNLPGQLVGTAPKAKFWLLRTEDAYTETLQEEVNWLVGAEFADSVGADVINSSLGYSKFDGGIGDHFYSDMDGNTTIISNAADWAAAKGIFVTTSAGNAGGPTWFKITAPADADSVLTVGAVDSAGAIAGFSSRGLTFDGRIKPNTCARGVQAVVAAAFGGTMTAGGTSFSSPITAGAVACLWQSNPSATNMQLLDAIQQSASQYWLPDSIKGYGIPNFCVADSILSFVLSVNANSIDVTNLSVYPNPFNSNFVIDFYAVKKETILVELYDVTGRKVTSQQQIVFANTQNKFTLSDITNTSKGVYTLRLISSDKTYFSKIIKQ